MQIQMEKLKLTVFADYMIVFEENPSKFTKTTFRTK